MRIDQLLVERGLATSRSQAQRLIRCGWRAWRLRWRLPGPGKRWPRTATSCRPAPSWNCWTRPRRGLSRAAGSSSTARSPRPGLDVSGWRCLDVGQSTGGFTDCLLQRGAAHVTGVDVGHGQLHPRLRADARVTCMEGVNARTLDASDLIANNDHSVGYRPNLMLNLIW
jgi:23S rRNA (cytidine1920-2'-O)/16S rRNA (cytidine1409-2'-O)-methyltransferase